MRMSTSATTEPMRKSTKVRHMRPEKADPKRSKGDKQVTRKLRSQRAQKYDN